MTYTPHAAHLVGSINLPDAETVMRTAAAELGDRLARMPDGEVGDRFHWVAFQPDRMARTPGLEREGDHPIMVGTLDIRKIAVPAGLDLQTLELAPLGYAEAALESWAVFSRLQGEGVIPARTRFQVSLPTPVGVVGSMVAKDDRERFEPVYERALFAELAQILAAIPHERLAIQWDNALEFGYLEGAGYRGSTDRGWFGEDIWAALAERAARQAAQVPADVALGYHLCYGDIGEKHYVEPTDAGFLARFAQMLIDVADRRIDWIHLPVPIERDDEAYFAPLASLQLPAGTDLFLGLVHRQDGAEGAGRRIVAARAAVPEFGIATECGIGRAPADAVAGLFALHREVSTPL
ncbi:hypothetical protein QQX10_11765 [Demequina sp. SYSU T00039]|uniref:Uncharacterized protein n=1 Tax=Demequina lignilytica TaxID=3051663 RepID=A0AAW7M9T2_9MICO|nr:MULTISPECIES: hypothetical protein [unclassified Demequina]MDN4478965.1 hypothetical protein [Demequina sp. SYSU T00039-1]MDN4488840.1 hypothetical protein [Demequina sp. SYSU T00039]MDN4491447.1 hypothetical protein [Demequina sp. SYSU T00068]